MLVINNGASVRVKLRRVVGFLSPHFLLILRDNEAERRNTTVAHPSCLYRGDLENSDDIDDRHDEKSDDHNERHDVFVALSTCHETVSAVLVVNNNNYNVEFVQRVKREAAEMEADDENTHDMVITAPSGSQEHRCGLTQGNLKKMRVGDRPVVRLKRRKRRSRRSTKERVIEIAVFVDYDMYKANGKNTEAVQDLVFTYLNAVQMLYQSNLLTNKLRLVLVRLDIMTTSSSDLDTGGGDIETYLENFCRQKSFKIFKL